MLRARQCGRRAKTVQTSPVINHIEFACFVFAERRNPHSALSKHTRLFACGNAMPNRKSENFSTAIVSE
jgi:hypothetical protein